MEGPWRQTKSSTELNKTKVLHDAEMNQTLNKVSGTFGIILLNQTQNFNSMIPSVAKC